MIDLAALQEISVISPNDRLVQVEAGARWKDVAAALAPHGWALSSGDHGGVGVGGLVEHITPELAAVVAELLESGASYFFQVRSVGGAVADIAEDATAYSHRTANFSVVAFGASKQRLDDAWQDMSAHFAGLYLSFETDQSAQRVTEAWPPPTLARLRALKHHYDPTNIFRDNFNIDPMGD